MNGKPLVTVFLPTLNAQLYLIEALESLCAQTFRDFKVSIVDGGSTDATPEICAAYCRTGPSIQFLRAAGHDAPGAVQRGDGRLRDRIYRHCSFRRHSASQAARMPGRAHEPACGHRHVGHGYGVWLHDFHGGWSTPYSGIAEYPRSHDEIVGQLPFWWCFANPTLIYRAPHFCRKELFPDTRFRFSGDYLFYWRAARSGPRGKPGRGSPCLSPSHAIGRTGKPRGTR